MVPREVDWNKQNMHSRLGNIDHPLCSLSDKDFVLEKLLPSPKRSHSRTVWECHCG